MAKEPAEKITARTMGALVQFIEQRQYVPGERLPSERELAERFDVGRGVVREVLSVLENLRYLERRPNSGIYLNEAGRSSHETLALFSNLNVNVSKERLAEAMEARRILEVQAIALAAQRRTDADLRSMREIVERFGLAAENDLSSLATLDYEFHMAIFRAAHNLVLMQLVTPFYLMSESRGPMFFNEKARGLASNEQHKLLVAAIDEQDVMKAQQLMSEHIDQVQAHYHV